VLFRSEIINQEERELVTDNMNHLMAWDIEAQLDSRNYLKISPNLSYSSVNTTSHSNDTIKNRNIVSERVYRATDQISTPNFDMDVLYSRMFNKPGRKFVINMQGKYAKRDKLEDLNDYFESVNRSEEHTSELQSRE